MPSKNTFVHFPVQHITLDPSEERRTKSCPSSGVEMAAGQEEVHEENTAIETVDVPFPVEATPMNFPSFMEFGMDNVVTTGMQGDLCFPSAAMPMDEPVSADDVGRDGNIPAIQ